MKKFIPLFLVFVIFLLIGCSSPTHNKEVKQVMGEIEYQVINQNSSGAENLFQGNFGKWYKDNLKIKGLHSFIKGKESYILLSAGEKQTGGYSIENVSAIGKKQEIIVTGVLKKPAKDELVTMALSYPHILICIPEDGRKLVFGGISEISTNRNEQIKKDTGRYLGQIDSNSVEISISGVPETIPPRAFQLGDKLKYTIDQLKLNTGDNIIFTYIEKENQRPIMIELSKINN